MLIFNGMLCHSFGPLGGVRNCRNFLYPTSPFLLSFHLTWLTPHAHLPCMLAGMRQSQGLEIMARQEGYALLAKEGENKYSLSLSSHSLSRKSFPFIKNCGTVLIRGRKLKRVTQRILKYFFHKIFMMLYVLMI